MALIATIPTAAIATIGTRFEFGLVLIEILFERIVYIGTLCIGYVQP